MSEQALHDMDRTDVWAIVVNPRMYKNTPKELAELANNFVFETQEGAKKTGEQAAAGKFFGWTVTRKTLLKEKQILKMSAFREKVTARLDSAEVRQRLNIKAYSPTEEEVAGLYADYFKSGRTFEDWLQENIR